MRWSEGGNECPHIVELTSVKCFQIPFQPIYYVNDPYGSIFDESQQ